MARYLFATVPADGHTLPALPIARALIERGHSVRWYAGAKYAEKIGAAGAAHAPMGVHDYSLRGLDEFYPRRRELRGMAKLQFDMVDAFARPAGDHVPALLDLLDEEPADVIVADTGMLAALLVAQLRGLPLAVVGISVVGFPSRDLPPFGLGLAPSSGLLSRIRNRALDLLTRRVLFRPMTRVVNEIRSDLGLPTKDDMVFEYALGADLYLQMGAEGFEYPRSDLPPILRYVGPPRQVSDPSWQPPAWWSELGGDRPVVVLNQGTVATDSAELIRPGLDALAGEDVLVVAVTGGSDPALIGEVPANARVERYIPFDRLLPHVDVLVTNGGFGGVQLALAHGVPMVAAGTTEDKIEVTARVAHSGVGINLRTQTPSSAQVREAVRAVLADGHYARRAQELAVEIAAAGREEGAVQHLEELARSAGDSRDSDTVRAA